MEPQETPHPNHPQARDASPNRCRRCPGTVVVRLNKTRRSDNDIYRCTRCGLIFSPASNPPPKLDTPQSAPQSAPQGGAAMSRKLNRKNPAANETSNSYEKKHSSYDAGRRSASKKKFLAAHQLGASTRQAARIAGVSRGTLYRWRNQDPEFAQASVPACAGMTSGWVWE